MEVRPGSLLDEMRAYWLAQGWPLEDLRGMRMQAGSGGDDGSSGGDGDDGAGGSGTGGGDGRGFPADTPLSEMTVDQREAYWRHQARRHEAAWKGRAGDVTPEQVAEWRKAAEELEEVKRQQMTAQERAVAEARDEAAAAARREALEEVGGELVAARIEAAAAGRLSADQLSALVESIDLAKYLSTDGKVNVDKVKALVDTLAPADDRGRRFPDLGQGQRDDKPSSGVAAGRELFEARRRKAS